MNNKISKTLCVFIVISIIFCIYPITALAKEQTLLDISKGSINITDTQITQDNIVIEDKLNPNGYQITGESNSNSLIIETSEDVNITFKDLKIVHGSDKVAINSGKTIISLQGDNEIGYRGDSQIASIYVAPNATIEFSEKSTGNLNVYCATNSVGNGNAAAAIGAHHKYLGRNLLDAGTIIINGGHITARAGYGSAGIGGGNGTKVKKIIINGGYIDAQGGKRAQGIGSGKDSYVEQDIIITNGIFSEGTTVKDKIKLSVPTATLSYNDLSLINTSSNWKYSLDDGKSFITSITDKIEFSEEHLNKLKNLMIVNIGDNRVTEDSDTQTIAIIKNATPDAPQFISANESEIKVEKFDGQEYAISKSGEDNYSKWQDSGIFKGKYKNGETYDIITRTKRNENGLTSEASSITTVKIIADTENIDTISTNSNVTTNKETIKKTNKSNNNIQPKNPQTKDNNDMKNWILILFSSLFFILIIIKRVQKTANK